MSQRVDFKKFALKVMLKADGTPLRDAHLQRLVGEGFTPRPPLAEIGTALNELSDDGYIAGVLSDLDKSVTWSLTTKGEHEARKLNE